MRNQPRRVLALGALLLLGCSGGGGSHAPPGPASSVSVLATTCPSGVGNLPGSNCLVLRVDKQGLPPADVELRITEPDPGVPYIGTAVLCSGTNGDEFFADLPGGEELLGEFVRLGLRVVDRRWQGGWLTTGFQLKPLSERLALLLDWVHANEHSGGLFFAVGNSGGAGELAYSLTTWDREALFDAVVLAGGPPFTRLDYLCLPPAPPWNSQCPGLVPTLECGLPPCTAPASSSICSYLAGQSAVEMQENSLLHPGADTDFGAAELHFLVGADDCSEWVPQAFLFESAVASQHTVQLVPQTPHTVSATPQGRDAIVQALLGFAPAPASGAHLGLSFTLVEDGAAALTLRARAQIE